MSLEILWLSISDGLDALVLQREHPTLDHHQIDPTR
jgi:hypothetical protein